MSVVDELTIKGHPGMDYQSADGRELRIQLCAECGAMRSVLWLTGDRWYCRACRAEGVQKPTVIPVSNPARRR